ncbi:hypothetical protein [Streptomyces sp. NPDC085540]|uniref:hypothetical protein n=1 Tax=Streptomyces sp. NPDC085540 TaxID=3365730 RepID=UPI0037D4F813
MLSAEGVAVMVTHDRARARAQGGQDIERGGGGVLGRSVGGGDGPVNGLGCQQGAEQREENERQRGE